MGILEAQCSKCGQTFNPADEDDLIHAETLMGQECGGKGNLLGQYV